MQTVLDIYIFYFFQVFQIPSQELRSFYFDAFSWKNPTPNPDQSSQLKVVYKFFRHGELLYIHDQ